MTYDSTLAALHIQQGETGRLCKSITQEYCDKKKPFPASGIIGFTLEQYESAKKTLELAIQLARPDLGVEQIQESRLEISVSRISLKLMREDLIRAGKAPDENAYLKIDALAQKALSIL